MRSPVVLIPKEWAPALGPSEASNLGSAFEVQTVPPKYIAAQLGFQTLKSDTEQFFLSLVWLILYWYDYRKKALLKILTSSTSIVFSLQFSIINVEADAEQHKHETYEEILQQFCGDRSS